MNRSGSGRAPFPALCVAGLLAACQGSPPSAPVPVTPPRPEIATTGATYATTSWPTLHRDSRNSDYAPIVADPEVRVAWETLDGAAIWVGPTLGPEGNVYVSSGQGEGYSNLRALDSDGNLLWEAAPQTSLADLDHGAVISAPIVDREGNVYQADSNQLWSFSPLGEVRWVADLTAHGAEGLFVTPIFTKEGHVAGITTDGILLAFDRATGHRVWSAFELPGAAGPPALAPPPGYNGGGMLAPDFRQEMWNIVMGREVVVGNTPAVHPETGRIYITGAGETAETGALHAIDTGSGGPVLAFTTPMGGGSGTSPALSPGSDLVYVADGEGHMLAVDAESGAVVWRADGVQGAASPSINPDGTVYSFSGSRIVALDGRTGEVAWSRSYDDLAEDQLAELAGGGAPLRGNIDGILTLTDGPEHTLLWACINLGVEYGTTTIPRRIVLAALDARDGRTLSTTEIRDSSSALIVPAPGGRIYISLAGVTTSSLYFGVGDRLPESLRRPGPPKAGLVALDPVSRDVTP